MKWALGGWALVLHRRARTGIRVVFGERDPAGPRPCASLNCRAPHPHPPTWQARGD